MLSREECARLKDQRSNIEASSVSSGSGWKSSEFPSSEEEKNPRILGEKNPRMKAKPAKDKGEECHEKHLVLKVHCT